MRRFRSVDPVTAQPDQQRTDKTLALPKPRVLIGCLLVTRPLNSIRGGENGEDLLHVLGCLGAISSPSGAAAPAFVLPSTREHTLQGRFHNINHAVTVTPPQQPEATFIGVNKDLKWNNAGKTHMTLISAQMTF